MADARYIRFLCRLIYLWTDWMEIGSLIRWELGLLPEDGQLLVTPRCQLYVTSSHPWLPTCQPLHVSSSHPWMPNCRQVSPSIKSFQPCFQWSLQSSHGHISCICLVAFGIFCHYMFQPRTPTRQRNSVVNIIGHPWQGFPLPSLCQQVSIKSQFSPDSQSSASLYCWTCLFFEE